MFFGFCIAHDEDSVGCEFLSVVVGCLKMHEESDCGYFAHAPRQLGTSLLTTFNEIIKLHCSRSQNLSCNNDTIIVPVSLQV